MAKLAQTRPSESGPANDTAALGAVFISGVVFLLLTAIGVRRSIRGGDISFLYTIPTFQNPTGRTLPLERRRAIAAAKVTSSSPGDCGWTSIDAR